MLFLGITDSVTAERLAARPRFCAAAAGNLATLCAEETPAAPNFFFARKPHPLERLVDVRRLLEAVGEIGPLLAATPGAEAESPEAALAALGGHLAPFATTLDRYGRAREFQIGVFWDAPETLRALAEREAHDLGAARALGRDVFGAAIARAMAAERARYSEEVRTALQRVALDALDLPTPDENQIANLLVMIGHNQEPKLDAALQRLDALLPGEPRIRCIGPLPAHSFVAIELKRADAGAMARARDLLEVQPGASQEALKAAFRTQAKSAHPDSGGDPSRFRALVEARTLLAAFAERGDAVASIRLAGAAR